MRKTVFMTTLAVAFAAGLGAASAANAAGPVNLTQSQKNTIKSQLSSQNAQAVPGGFTASIGAKVPTSVSLKPLPSKVASQVKSVKDDEYAKLKDNQILIVEPSNRKVVAMINENGTTGSASNTMNSSTMNKSSSMKPSTSSGMNSSTMGHTNTAK